MMTPQEQQNRMDRLAELKRRLARFGHIDGEMRRVLLFANEIEALVKEAGAEVALYHCHMARRRQGFNVERRMMTDLHDALVALENEEKRR